MSKTAEICDASDVSGDATRLTREKRHALVAGPGYIGMLAALGLADVGWHVTLVGKVDAKRAAQDTRSTALFPESVALLERLRLRAALGDEYQALRGIRIVDASSKLLKAPEETFRAEEAGLAALAYNFPNAALHRVLLDAIVAHDEIMQVDMDIVAAETREDVVTLIGGAGEQVSGDIVIGADGRNSIVRQSVGIAVKSWAYEQVAVACQFAHSAPHDNISTEFHRAAGPLTVVPGAPDASGDAEHVSHLVWIETPDVAASLAALDDAAFSRSLSRHLQGLLGAIGPLGPRGCFPISGAHAQRYATDRVILAGEAAHVLPPIGAQGMNLGMRDVLALIELLGPADVSIADAVQRYDSARRSDAYVRTTGVDLLNRSLTTRHWPLQALRGAGLHAIGALPALKRAVISAGFGGGVSPDAQTRGESN